VAISFDASKNERNIASRGISFEAAAEFEWDTALIAKDTRRDYGERRYQALGVIDGRLHMLVFGVAPVIPDRPRVGDSRG
jgi:uncharacterized DUF497 family protein